MQVRSPSPAGPSRPASAPAQARPASIALPPSAAEVRRLGAVFLFAAALLFALSAWKARHGHWPWQTYAAGAFAVLGCLCLILGRRAAGIHRAWTALGAALGRVVSPAVLAVLYFLVVTPFGLVSRLLRRDRLGLRPDPEAGTYWREPAIKRTDRARLLRQY
jgi:hypothetical protein